MKIRQQRDAIQWLYQTMPGAPLPSTHDGWYQWGDVEGNDHWQFCAAIVALIDAAAEAAGKGGVS
jgi:hypothetical protein